MANPQPISVDEAAILPTRLVRSASTRQRGRWVYLDAALLRRIGLDPERDIEAMRYGLVERRKRGDGSPRAGHRVILNLSYVTVTWDEKGEVRP